MNQKKYFTITAIIFLIIFLFHLFRIIYGVEAVFWGWVAPMWLSWVAFAVSGFLSYQGFKLLKM